MRSAEDFNICNALQLGNWRSDRAKLIHSCLLSGRARFMRYCAIVEKLRHLVSADVFRPHDKQPPSKGLQYSMAWHCHSERWRPSLLSCSQS